MGTERQKARDPAARDEGQGRVREDEQTRGRTGPGSRSREGGGEGELPRKLLGNRARAGRRVEGKRWQRGEGVVLLADQRMQIVCPGG